MHENKGENLATSVTIQAACPEDVSKIKECLIDSWVEHAKAEPGLLDEQRMRESKVKNIIRNVLINR
jgi:hypothetical protein